MLQMKVQFHMVTSVQHNRTDTEHTGFTVLKTLHIGSLPFPIAFSLWSLWAYDKT